MMREFGNSLKVIASMLCLLLLSAMPASAASLRITVLEAGNESGIADAVVELVALDDTATAASPVIVSVDQRDKEFIPPVTVIPVGSQVAFPNSDDILHHVYSFSPVRSFDIPLYGSNDSAGYSETFDDPGVVEIGCNIHDWMLAYIYVSDAHYAAVSDESGAVELADVPPGTYRLQVWHPRLTSEELAQQEVTVGSSVDQELSVSLELGRDRRLRRAPTTTRNRYR